MIRTLICRTLGHDWDGAEYRHWWATLYRCKCCGATRSPED
ncbi:hypothetical protein ACOI1H_13485 [Loktanella sp. DJP18]